MKLHHGREPAAEATELAPRHLVRATELVGLPVLAITEGEAVAEVKDVLYVPEQGGLAGFTLNRRRRLGGPLKDPLPRSAVFAIGPDAVTIADSGALHAASPLAAAAKDDSGRNVLGNEVLTDTGARIGVVTDLVVAIGVVTAPASDGSAPPDATWRAGDVVGYELAGEGDGPPRFLPLPHTLAVSGEFLMVPAGVEPFIRDELSVFEQAIYSFRESLRPPSPGGGDPAGGIGHAPGPAAQGGAA